MKKEEAKYSKVGEEHQPTKIYDCYYYCSSCGEEVKQSGNLLLRNPPIYEYVCKCEKTYNLDKCYPTLGFR